MHDLNLAIVDVETTGLSPKAERIIEIGILTIENGKLKETFSSLINPERSIPPFITSLTAIKPKDVEGAPTFKQIHKQIYNLLKDKTFVAHNVKFDYNFLNCEFERLGKDFNFKQMCTAKLSRKLFPEQKGHSLDKIIHRFRLSYDSRHRALDDAKILWQFIQLIYETFPKEKIEAAIQKQIKRPNLPPNIKPATIDKLPNTAGVYIFYNEKGTPLYVGKSVGIRTRVLSHFSDKTEKEMSLRQQTTDIEALPTAGEMSALLLESHLVKNLLPMYNRQLRESRRIVVLKRVTNKDSYDSIQIEDLTSLEVTNLENTFGIFKSKKQAQNFLFEKVNEYGLCPKLLGLEKGKGACFSHQIKKCSGACVGKELPVKYNIKMTEAFYQSKIKRWPFKGPILIEEGQLNEKKEAYLVDQWCLIGKMHWDIPLDLEIAKNHYTFDYDSYKILVKHLLNPNKNLKIKVLQNYPKNPSDSHAHGLN